MLSPEIHKITPPATLDEFTDLVIALKDRVFLSGRADAPVDLSRFRIPFRKSVFSPWFAGDFRGDVSRPIAGQLNHPSGGQLASLFRVGQARGGPRGACGGIFWADASELSDPLHGFMQVVGHNRVKEVTERAGDCDSRIVFCDCLRMGKYWYGEGV